MPLTQLAPYGAPGERYGSFAGKSASPSHPVARLTQLGDHAVPMRRYKVGAFAGRAEAAGAANHYIPTFRPRRGR